MDSGFRPAGGIGRWHLAPPDNGKGEHQTLATQSISLEVKQGVAWLTMNRPDSLNALNPALISDLRDFFSSLAERHDIRVVVLSGAGRAFCAGLDLTDMGGSGTGGGPSAGLRFQRRIKAHKLAEEMLATSPLGLRLTKECLNMSLDAGSLEQVIAMEDRNQILCTQTQDMAEGVNSFLQKRKPEYQDR